MEMERNEERENDRGKGRNEYNEDGGCGMGFCGKSKSLLCVR